MFIAVSVNRVLSTPNGMPHSTTHAEITVWLCTPTAITTRITVNSANARAKAFTGPSLVRSHGAPGRPMPTSTPHPKNRKPMPYAPKETVNGVKASTAKKPTL